MRMRIRLNVDSSVPNAVYFIKSTSLSIQNKIYLLLDTFRPVVLMCSSSTSVTLLYLGGGIALVLRLFLKQITTIEEENKHHYFSWSWPTKTSLDLLTQRHGCVWMKFQKKTNCAHPSSLSSISPFGCPFRKLCPLGTLDEWANMEGRDVLGDPRGDGKLLSLSVGMNNKES